MTLEQLRIFIAVAEQQHVTRAARLLNLAQSAASGAVGSLEDDLQVRLFSRIGRRIELTEAGRLFLDEARAVLERAGAARHRLAEIGELRSGRLRIHASQTIAGYWLPRHLMTFRTRYPGVEVAVCVGNTADVAAAVRSGGADIGFAEGVVVDAELVACRVAGDRLVVVVSSAHPWAGSPRVITPAQLGDVDWVLREVGSGTRSVFEAALPRLGVALETLSIVLELPTNEAVRAAVEASLAATAISASVASPSLEAGLLHHVPLLLPERAFSALRHRERYQSRAAQALLSLIAAAGRHAGGAG